jgi:hypothetical protein
MQRVNLSLKPDPKDYSLADLLELRRNLPPPTEKLTSPIMDIMDPIWDFVYDQTEEMTEK